MAGNSTKFGFAGAGTGAGGPSARTVYGREVHLSRSALDAAKGETGAPPDVAPAPRVLADLAEQPTDQLPQASASDDAGPRRKSRFPALARFFGRWNTQGNFDSFEHGRKTDTLVPPREPYLRTAGIVAAASLVSFFAVVALLKLRDTELDRTPAISPATSAPVPQESTTPPSVPTASPITPSPPPTITPLPPSEAVLAPDFGHADPPSVVPHSSPTVVDPAAASRRSNASHRPSRPRPAALDPDSPMPLKF